MNANLKRIFRQVRASAMPENRQKRLVGFLSFIADERLKPIADQFDRTPEWMPEFLEIIETKFSALLHRDRAAYEKAVALELSAFTQKEKPAG
jgi:hypothetical protein